MFMSWPIELLRRLQDRRVQNTTYKVIFAIVMFYAFMLSLLCDKGCFLGE